MERVGNATTPSARQQRFEGLDIREPEVDLVALAQSLGVDAVRVQEPDELTQRLRAATHSDRPLLIDVPISRDPSPRLQYG